MFIISIVGIDGAGKTTQITKLHEKYIKEKSGRKIGILKEPRMMRKEIIETSQKVGKVEGIDDCYLSMVLLKDGYLDRIEEKRSDYDIILRDRDTTICQYAYHHGSGTPDPMNLGFGWVINRISCSDVLILIDTDVEVALKRINEDNKRNGKVENYFENREKLTKAKANYLSIFKGEIDPSLMGIENTKLIIVDGNKDKEAVFQDILAKL